MKDLKHVSDSTTPTLKIVGTAHATSSQSKLVKRTLWRTGSSMRRTVRSVALTKAEVVHFADTSFDLNVAMSSVRLPIEASAAAC